MYETEKVAEEMLAAGMEQLSKDTLLKKLDDLGYYVDKKEAFTYVNYLNGLPYHVKSVYIEDKKTKESFAHVDGKRDADFDALQKIRYGCFVVEKIGSRPYIWEL